MEGMREQMWLTIGQRRRHRATTVSWLKDAYAGFGTRFRNLPLPKRRGTLALNLRCSAYRFHVRMGHSDRWVASEVLISGEYAAFAETVSRPVHLVLDLGGNIGAASRFWQERFPGAKVVSVEPDEANICVAAKNASSGPAPGDICILQAFVAAASDEARVEREGRDAWGYRMAQKGGGSGPTVRKLTVPQALAEAGVSQGSMIDVLKCDIEGGEAEVFGDCAGWIGHVKYFAVEVHAPYTADHLIRDMRAGGAEPLDVVVEAKTAGLSLVQGRLSTRDR